jgi:hypothetical protein
LTLSVRTEGTDERLAPLVSEGTQLETDLGAHEVGLPLGTADAHALIAELCFCLL